MRALSLAGTIIAFTIGSIGSHAYAASLYWSKFPVKRGRPPAAVAPSMGPTLVT
jgi:hypothetical protein